MVEDDGSSRPAPAEQSDHRNVATGTSTPSGGPPRPQLHSYKAFVSYSHAADSALSPTLQAKLERFAKPWYRIRNFRIFRDATNLSVAPALWPKIEDALGASEYLLLMASPPAAQSRWVKKELAYWKANKGVDKLLIILTDGAISWDEGAGDFNWAETTALPDTLRGVFRQEPLYLDFSGFRINRLSLSDPKFLDQVATVAATLHGKSKDEISGEHIRQHRRTMRLAWSAMATLMTLLVLATVTAIYAFNERSLAITGRQDAERNADDARRKLVRLHVTNGNRSLAEGDLAGSLVWYVQALKNDRVDPLREDLHRVRIGAILAQCPKLLHIWKVREGDQETAVSPDGRLVATRQADGTARAWELATGEPVTPALKHDGPITTIAFSPDGRVLVTGGQDKTVRVWDPKTGNPIGRPLEHPMPVGRLSFTLDGKVVVAQFAVNGFKVWNLLEGTLIAEPGPIEPGIADGGQLIEYSPSGPNVIRANAEGLRVYSLMNGQPIGPTIPGTAEATASQAIWSPDGGRIAYVVSRPYGSYLAIVDVFRSPANVTRIALPEVFNVYAVAFSHDGSMIAVGGGAGTRGARVWDSATGMPVTDLLDHQEVVYHVEFTPDDLQLVTSSGLPGTGRGEIAAFRLRSGQSRAFRLPQNASVLAGNVSLDGTRVVARCATGPTTRTTAASFDPIRGGVLKPGDQVRVWQIVKEGPRVKPLVHRSGVSTVAFRPGGRRAVTAGGTPSLWGMARAGAARAWDLASGRELGPVLRHPGAISHARFSPDGGRLMTIGREGKVLVWEAGDGRPAGPPIEQLRAIGEGTFSPDGSRILTVDQADSGVVVGLYESWIENLPPLAPRRFEDRSEPGVARVWDVASGKPVSPTLAHEWPVVVAAFVPGGGSVLTIDFHDVARLWDVAKGTSSTPEWARDHAVVDAKFTDDGKAVLVQYRDNTVRLWDLATGRPLMPPIAHADSVSLASYNAPGRRILTTLFEGSLRVWDSSTAEAMTPFLKIDEPGSPSGAKGIGAASFSPDGRLIFVGIGVGSSFRVLDAETLDFVSPPLTPGWSASPVAYDGAARRLSTATVTAFYEWDLKPVAGDLPELELLARLLSGLRPDDLGGAVPISLDDLVRDLDALKARRGPEPFTLDAETLAGWNYSEWEANHLPARPRAAAFHLGAFIGLRPKQPFLRRPLAEALLATGRVAEARAVLEDELKLRKALPECDPIDVAEVLLWIGRAADPARPDDARKAYKEALELAVAASGEKSLDAARMLASLGDFEASSGNFAEAERLLRPATEILAVNLPGEDEERATQNDALAYCLFRQSRPEEAEALYHEQYERARKATPRPDGTLIRALSITLNDLVGFYNAWGKPEKAHPFAQQLEAAGIRDRATNQGPDQGPKPPGTP